MEDHEPMVTLLSDAPASLVKVPSTIGQTGQCQLPQRTYKC